ncbi:hypothetical protein FRC01_000555 [Tulasnella sp. 417]|nr:hypothetical protein FRC01_000555 [Tulasnella sp. 417]
MTYIKGKQRMGAPKASTTTAFNLTTVGRNIETQVDNSRQNSRNNTPVNSPSTNRYSERTVRAPRKDQVDDRQLCIRKGYPTTSYPLLYLYTGVMKNNEHTQVTLTALRPVRKRALYETFMQWKREVRKRLVKEFDDWKRVDGPFVKYNHYTWFSGVPALVTEFIEGTGAKEYLEKKSVKYKRRMILKFARALRTLHRGNLSHGSIEPCHFIVDKKGKAKVGGYCFNRMVEEEFEKLYPSEENRLSARYVAPEFLESRKTDKHTDVYSFALLAMELLTGVQPFASVSKEASLIGRVRRGEPPFAEEIAQDDAWQEVLSSCWVKEPSARPSMERLYKELSKTFKK